MRSKFRKKCRQKTQELGCAKCGFLCEKKITRRSLRQVIFARVSLLVPRFVFAFGEVFRALYFRGIWVVRVFIFVRVHFVCHGSSLPAVTMPGRRVFYRRLYFRQNTIEFDTRLCQSEVI